MQKEYVIANAGTSPTSFSDWQNNVEQIFGKSPDVKESLKFVNNFVKEHSDDYICCVGHSKGGAEAAINAVRFNLDAKIFNPASANLKAYDADKTKYHGHMTAYIVKDEVLNTLEGSISKPIGDVFYLPSQHWTDTPLVLAPVGGYNMVQNHMMGSVMTALDEIGEE